MLVNLFRKNYINQYLFILLISILLWVGSFIAPQPMAEYESFSYLYSLFYTLLSPFPLLATILAYIMVFTQGLMFNQIFNRQNLIPNNTLLPMFLYVLFLSAVPIQNLNPILFSNLFILLAINRLMDCTNTQNVQDKIFSAAILLSVASLFYIQSLYFLLLLPLTLIIFKIYYWREWVTILFGYAFPQIILMLYAFFTDRLQIMLDSLKIYITSMSLNIDTTNKIVLISNIFIILVFAVSFFVYLINTSESIVAYRKKTSIISWTFVICIVLSLYTFVIPLPIQICAIPFSFFISRYILKFKHKQTVIDILFLLLVVALFVNVYLV